MALKLSKNNEDEEDDSTFWLITYSDMTTLLLAFFLLMFSFTLMSMEKQQALLEQLNQVATEKKQTPQQKEDLEATAKQIAKEFEKDATFINATEEEVTVGLSSNVTFALGGADLTPAAKAPLIKVAAILSKLPNPIRVEGHTDDIPMRGGRYQSNWHLSAARAQEVVKLLIEQGVDPRRLQVIGFGENQPRMPNDSEANRAANRRIELKLVRTQD